MLSFQRRTIGVEAAAIAVPILLVYFGRVMIASPAPQTGAVQVNTPVIVPTAGETVVALSPEQQKAAEWLRLLPPKYDLATPLNHIEAQAAPPKPKPVDEAPVVRANPIEGLKLSAVMGNENDQLASINGKIYRIGDAVRPGLKLTGIDHRRSRIVLTDSEGATYEIKRDQKY